MNTKIGGAIIAKDIHMKMILMANLNNPPQIIIVKPAVNL
jgi:hypothetical protein